MKVSKEELARVYQQQTSREARGRPECPEAGQLAAAALNQLTPADRERVTGHLATCSDCAQEYRTKRYLASWPSAELLAGTGLLRNEANSQASKTAGKRRPFSWFWPVPAFAAMAVLAVVSIGLGVSLLALRNDNRNLRIALNRQAAAGNQMTQQASLAMARNNQLEADVAALRGFSGTYSQAQVNVPIIDLDPSGVTRGAAAATGKQLSIPWSVNVFALLLNVSGEPRFADYSIDLTDSAGKVLWTGTALKKSAFNNFAIVLPRKAFRQGKYFLNLYGTDVPGAAKVPVEHYAMEFR